MRQIVGANCRWNTPVVHWFQRERRMGRVRCRGTGIYGAIAVVAAALGAGPANAFPDKPIRMVVSFPAGGTGDAVARVLADGLSARMKQTIVVDNQGGAAGTIGAAIVARATPDGYTMLVSATSVFAIVPNMRKVEFDPIGDLTPVARVGESLRALAVNPKLPANTVAELVAYAKKNPGKLNYGSAGPGSTVHILTESFRRAAGIDLVHIPYRGAAPALQGLLAGDIEMLVDTVVIPHIKAGTVRGLAAVGPARLDELPDLPTLAEAGYPSVRTSGWSALFGPAKLSPELVKFYAGHVEGLFKDQAFITRLIATGSVPAFLAPAPFADYVKEDNAYFGKLIRDAGIKLQN
jgi:tripartite-type tricarboxylate transporter receptor subunit TctC